MTGYGMAGERHGLLGILIGAFQRGATGTEYGIKSAGAIAIDDNGISERAAVFFRQ